MAKDRPPSFQFYPRDFMADTGHLTDRQRSRYLLGLCRSWMEGGFGVGDPEEWRDWLGYESDEEWVEDGPVLRGLFFIPPCDPEYWVQKRMASERGEQAARYRSASLGARIANATRTHSARIAHGGRTHSATPASASASAFASKEDSKQEDVRASRGTLVRPTIEEVTAYCSERKALGKPPVDPRAWFDHYTSNGWRVGRNAMKDWRAAVRTWERVRGWESPGVTAAPEASGNEKVYSAAKRLLSEIVPVHDEAQAHRNAARLCMLHPDWNAERIVAEVTK